MRDRSPHPLPARFTAGAVDDALERALALVERYQVLVDELQHQVVVLRAERDQALEVGRLRDDLRAAIEAVRGGAIAVVAAPAPFQERPCARCRAPFRPKGPHAQICRPCRSAIARENNGRPAIPATGLASV